MARSTPRPKLIIPGDLEFHRVKIPGARGINISTPTAEDGIAAMEYYIDVRERLLTEGMPYDQAKKVAMYESRLRFGAEEFIQAIALCVGQEPLKRAIMAHKVYRIRGTEYAKAESFEEIEHLEDD